MDFKALISKIESIDGKIETPSAPTLPKSVQLNEDAELRVLAGTSSYVTEAKKKAEEKKEEKVDEATKTPSTWTDMKGNKHPATKVKGDKYQGKEAEDDEKKDKKSKKDESIEPQFKSKFMKMVEAKKAEKDSKKSKKEKMEEGSKPDFLDLDKDGNKSEPMKSAAKSKSGDKKDGKKGMSDKQAKYFGKKNESVAEAEEKRAPAKKSEREVTLPSGAKVKATKVQGWQSQKADKEADKEKNESVKSSKKVVAESVEQKMSFKDMMKLVVESGGQQAIDPLDAELFAWATRVAKNKLGEGIKSEVYAGMVYERMGGRFEMYDVLSEDQN